MKITDMKTGDIVTVKLVLAEVSLRQTSTKPPRDFLSTTFTDGINTIAGNLWNYSAKASLPVTGKVYTVDATVDEYRDKKQLNIRNMVLEDNQDLSEFVVKYIPDATDVINGTILLINQISNKKLYNVTKHIYDRHLNEIVMASGAKAVHHVGLYGNLYHCYETARIAIAISKVFEESDDSLVTAGALLHDIGKIFTYGYDGVSVYVTEAGSMLDHIVLGIRILDETEKEFGPDYADIFGFLKHIVASHHKEQEYGSPVTPRFLEAYIVAAADSISASAGVLLDANKKAIAEGKTMTDKLFTLSNREHFLQEDIHRRLV